MIQFVHNHIKLPLVGISNFVPQLFGKNCHLYFYQILFGKYLCISAIVIITIIIVITTIITCSANQHRRQHRPNDSCHSEGWATPRDNSATLDSSPRWWWGSQPLPALAPSSVSSARSASAGWGLPPRQPTSQALLPSAP